MGFTYDPNLADNLSLVRFNVSDHDSTDYILQDEEINALLAANGDDVNKTSIKAAEALLAHWSKNGRVFRHQVGDLKIDYFNPVEFYQKLLKELRRRGALSAIPYAGGISVSDKETREDDTDRVKPAFTRGMHDGPSSLSDLDAADD